MTWSYTPLLLSVHQRMVNKQHVEYLANEITRCKRWITPVPIERQTGIIMDGNHRYQAAKKLGLSCIPCVKLDYSDNRVSVFHWNTGELFCPKKIRQHIVDNGMLFPYKTTRHQFSPPLPEVDFEIHKLLIMPLLHSEKLLIGG